MFTQRGVNSYQSNTGSYTYPEFVINERTGQIKVNLIDEASGRVVRHIPSTELARILRQRSTTSRRKAA